MELKVCVGSACHLKNSRVVIEEFKRLISENNLEDKITLMGSFCMGKCGEKGVSVMADNEFYSVIPEETETFFNEKVRGRL